MHLHHSGAHCLSAAHFVSIHSSAETVRVVVSSVLETSLPGNGKIHVHHGSHHVGIVVVSLLSIRRLLRALATNLRSEASHASELVLRDHLLLKLKLHPQHTSLITREAGAHMIGISNHTSVPGVSELLLYTTSISTSKGVASHHWHLGHAHLLLRREVVLVASLWHQLLGISS